MYATIRRYRVDTDLSSEVIEQIIEEFMPLMRVSPGILEYYLVDAQEGAFATVTICKDQAAVETSNTMAHDWMKRSLARRLLDQQGIRAFSVEVKEILQGPLYGEVSEIRASQAAPWLLSVEEVCEALGMGKSWVYRRLRSGEIPSVKLGRTIKVRRVELEEYLQRHHHPERQAVQEE